MNKDDHIAYLANIYLMLAVDGTVDRVEEKAFEQIAREIGAGYFERREAVKRARDEHYELKLMDRWSDRIRNLEDVLFAAYCDGVLKAAEKKFVSDYAGRTGITREQFHLIQEEAKRRYTEYKSGSG